MTARKKFQGTGTALVTPFKKDGSLDEAALRRLVDFQIKGGVEMLIPLGTTGETPTLNHTEYLRVFEIVIDQTRGRAKVFGGASSNNTQVAIENAKDVQRV